MLKIIAHRVLFNGIENNIKAIPCFKKLDIGIELDLRYNKNGAYISHDKTDQGILFEEACKISLNSNILMALHIKEIDVVKDAIRLLEKYSLNNYFMFNTENYDLSKIINKDNIASYVSQKQNKINADILWCDEINEKWYSKELISELHEKNKIIYSMSLEVVTSCNESEMINEWKRLLKIGIDGICTKYPMKLNLLLKEGVLY